MAGQGGSTELPDSLQKFFKVTLGMEWPEGNEGNLRELSAAWADLAAALERAALDARRSGDALDDVLRGDTGAANAKLIGEEYAASLTELANGADEFRKATKNAAADIQKGKIMLIVMAAMTLAAVIELLASLFGAIFIPATIGAAKVTMWALLRQMVKQMIEAVARLGLNKASAQTLLRGISKALAEATKRAALYGAGGAGLMAGLDGLIQVGQNDAGGREGLRPRLHRAQRDRWCDRRSRCRARARGGRRCPQLEQQRDAQPEQGAPVGCPAPAARPPRPRVRHPRLRRRTDHDGACVRCGHQRGVRGGLQPVLRRHRRARRDAQPARW